MNCDFVCERDDTTYLCTCRTCGRNVRARVLPVNARCLADTQQRPHHAEITQQFAVVTTGPGTALKQLLSTIGITASPDCSCNARAAEMDRQGADWCEENIETIVGWLREQAEARGLPFLDIVGRLLVKRAIRNARASTATKQTTHTPGNPESPPPG